MPSGNVCIVENIILAQSIIVAWSRRRVFRFNFILEPPAGWLYTVDLKMYKVIRLHE